MPPPPEDEPLYRTQIDRRLFLRLLSLARPHRLVLASSVVAPHPALRGGTLVSDPDEDRHRPLHPEA